MTEASTTSDLAGRLAEVRARMNQCAEQAERQPDEIRLVAVSKTHPVGAIREAIAAGVTDLGENRLQEAAPKIEEIENDAVRWHLIGPLQANKARRAVKLFHVVHTLDSIGLAQRLERICVEEERAELSVLIQLSLANEASKSGIHEVELDQLVEAVRTCPHLRLIGLMTLPPFTDEPETTRPYFRRLRELRDGLRERGTFGDLPGELSMGMSHDFPVAIEEGATMVRIGTAIFGERVKI
jgi:pyridoxal phosphate enzyme (YggS family)